MTDYGYFVAEKILPPGALLATFSQIVDGKEVCFQRKIFYHQNIEEAIKECNEMAPIGSGRFYSISSRRDKKDD